MTKGEINTIRNIVTRLKKPNCGASYGSDNKALIEAVNAKDMEAVSRIYLNTWIIPSLAMLLPESRDVNLAERMSR